MDNRRLLRRILFVVAISALISGVAAWGFGHIDVAKWIWAVGTIPIVTGLLVSMVNAFLSGRVGVDSVAFVSMSAALALGESLAGIVVAIMYAGGNLLEDFAVSRAEKNLKFLVDRAPRVAHVRKSSEIKDVPIGDVDVGDVIVVRGGEIIPVDGVIASAYATIDESALTGEPIPVMRQNGEFARSGTINVGETFEIRAKATAGESSYAGIVRLVTSAQTAKASFIRLADRYALLLLPATLIVAGGAWYFSGDPIRALAVLVAATPCPLILAAPVAFIAGVSQASQRGILIKGGVPLEALAQTRTVMFDKTGTLTVGGARLLAIETAPGEVAENILKLAGSLEQSSSHVAAAAIVKAAKAKGLSLLIPVDVRETMGSGVEGTVESKVVCVGSQQLVFGSQKLDEWAFRALRRAGWRSALCAFVSIDGRAVGALLLGDELRREAPRTVQALRSAGVSRIIMLTGDRADSAETIGAALDLDEVFADCTPADKVDAVRIEQHLHPTLMVGDGINDAPALAAANVGIAMGSIGASASSEAADVVILVDQVDRVSEAVNIAKQTRKIAVQSIGAGMALSGIAMGFAAIGWLPPVAGALTQEVIDVAVILNALRALKPHWKFKSMVLKPDDVKTLREDHEILESSLDQLRRIADKLDGVDLDDAITLIKDASGIVREKIVSHEIEDEDELFPSLGKKLASSHALISMSRSHKEIRHLTRMLERISEAISSNEVDRYLIRDAQRIIESIETVVRLHNAQEEDLYEALSH